MLEQAGGKFQVPPIWDQPPSSSQMLEKGMFIRCHVLSLLEEFSFFAVIGNERILSTQTE